MTVSRNKREGKLIGKHDGKYVRDKFNIFKGQVFSERFEPVTRKHFKIAFNRAYRNQGNYSIYEDF